MWNDNDCCGYFLQTVADIAKLTIRELNAHLKANQIRVRGTKNDKVTLLATKLGISTATDQDSAEESFHRTLRLLENSTSWSKDIQHMPVVTMAAIKDFLLSVHNSSHDPKECEMYTSATLQRYKTLRSYRHYEAGHVHSVEYGRGGNYHAVKAKCNPSWTTTGTQYAVMVLFVSNDSGETSLVGGKCTCVAGLGKACTHVAAVLFAMEDFCAKGLRKLPANPSCTELLSQWTAPRGAKCEPKPLSEVNVCKPGPLAARKKKKSRLATFTPTTRPVEFGAVQALIHGLNLCRPKVPFLRVAEADRFRPSHLPRAPTVLPPCTLTDVMDCDDPSLIPAREEETSTQKLLPKTLLELARNIIISREQVSCCAQSW